MSAGNRVLQNQCCVAWKRSRELDVCFVSMFTLTLSLILFVSLIFPVACSRSIWNSWHTILLNLTFWLSSFSLTTVKRILVQSWQQLSMKPVVLLVYTLDVHEYTILFLEAVQSVKTSSLFFTLMHTIEALLSGVWRSCLLDVGTDILTFSKLWTGRYQPFWRNFLSGDYSFDENLFCTCGIFLYEEESCLDGWLLKHPMSHLIMA